jgi:ethanolamine utilization cobalamin adenosyltransferase
MLELVKCKGERERNGQGSSDRSMEREIETLRAALRMAHESLTAGEGDMHKIAALEARLSDSIGRALLTQQKLSGSNDQIARDIEEIDRMMRVLGSNEMLESDGNVAAFDKEVTA